MLKRPGYGHRSIRCLINCDGIIILIIILLFIFLYDFMILLLFFLVPSVVKMPKVKNVKLKSNLEWLTSGVILIDEGASESNLIETLD